MKSISQHGPFATQYSRPNNEAVTVPVQQTLAFTKRANALPTVVFTLSMAYAVLRYVIFKGVAIDHIPLYIGNKAMAVSAAAMAAAVALAAPLARRYQADPGLLRKRWGASASFFAAIHVMVSMLLLQPGYFAKFFAEDGTLTWQSELAMLAGLGAALVMAALTVPKWRAILADVLGPASFLGTALLWLTACHVLAIGGACWFKPDTWPGSMPPMTLLAFFIVVGGAVTARLFSKPRFEKKPRRPRPGISR